MLPRHDDVVSITYMSPRHDDDGTVTSDQSNLEPSMNDLNKMNSSFGQMAEDNAETLDNKVTAVTAYLLPRSTTQPRSKSSYRSSQQKKLIKVLLDSGSDSDLLFIKKGSTACIPCCNRQVPLKWNTSAGTFTTKKVGKVDITFCEFDSHATHHVDANVVRLSKSDPTPMYDLILGTQTLNKLGVTLNFKDKTINMEDITLPMYHSIHLSKHLMARRAKQNYSLSPEPNSTAVATKRMVEILDAHYEKADLPAICKACVHLTTKQQQQLLTLLQNFEELFDGTLGDWKTTPVSLELKEGTKPYHVRRPFPVPKVHKELLLREVARLVKLGVLERQDDSEWASPSFIIPKANHTVRTVSDFREVNKRLVRKPFPLPKITVMLQEIEGFSYATSLDLNMGYYTIRLDADASKICTIIFPWGKYSYKRLPMGIAGSPDIFQAKMSELMAALEWVRTYLDDVLSITKGTFEDHLDRLKQVLQIMQKAGLRINAAKSKFCATEIEYLGYVLTQHGIKPQTKKVQAILALNPPKNVKELRSFLGMVQYYRDLWGRRSEMLTPLTTLVGECGQTKVTRAKGTKKQPWHWNESHQAAFDAVKATIVKDVMLAYPDYTKVFEVYTDASDTQLGAVITQGNRPIAFFSRKLSTTQQKYSVTEIELLAIVETLKEFKGMLWGQHIKVYTDHKNLLTDALGLTSDRVYRWRLLLEEYGPEIVWIKGIHNTVADAISRLDYNPTLNLTNQCHYLRHTEALTDQQVQRIHWKTFSKRWLYYQDLSQVNSQLINHTTTMNCVFANRSEEDEIYPLTVRDIALAQHADKDLKLYFTCNKPSTYHLQLYEDTEVVCNDGKIVIPKSLQKRAVMWYHHYLQHPGHTRLEETLKAAMYWKSMRSTVRSYVKKCRSCQINKRRARKFGKLPTKLVTQKPWAVLCVDLIGPYTLKGRDGTEIDFMCLTMIDPATSWFEVVELPVVQHAQTTSKTTGKSTVNTNYTTDTIGKFDKSSSQISQLVYKHWLCRYPRCQQIIYDNGSEFKLHFAALCDSYGIKRKPTSVKNPQANAILERVHQVLMNMLRTAELDMADSVDPEDISTFLNDAAWAIRSTYHTVLKASPGAVIFGRDMLFDIPYLADWTKIGEHRQKLTDLNTLRENKGRVDYDYQVNEKVLIVKDGILRKTESRYDSEPWTIMSVHTNGTITVQRGNKSQRINIRRVTPFFEEND